MRDRARYRRSAAPIAALAVVSLALPGLCFAQGFGRGRGRGPVGPPPVPEKAAPIDLTGYWVSVVTEDWLYRMVTPPKGDFASVPLNAEGRRVGNAWDPEKDIATSEQCKSYGAPAIMRVPGRLHITWADDHTLKIETGAGTQTRLFHFATAREPAGGEPLLTLASGAASGPPDWQGYSEAQWDLATGGRGPGGGFPGVGGRGPARGGSLEVVTTHLRPGYLRKNGVPYSANTVLTEYYDRTNETNGDSWLIVTTIVDDPQYLTGQFITSTNFKKEADGSKWSASPCTAK
ncbi:MAG: hypothetical protein ACRD2G_12370 [Terriglobia bacterium]